MMRTRRVGFVAGLALLAAACGASEAVPEASGPIEGIAVHGDWTIEVYDADGTLDERVEFENALQPSGAESLVQLLAGTQVLPPDPSWLILLLGDCDPACQFGQSIEDGFDGGELSVGVVGGGSEPSALVITGSRESAQAGTVESVSTSVRLCDPDDCNQPGSRRFTTKLLEPEDQVGIVEGQTVQVEVMISFT